MELFCFSSPVCQNFKCLAFDITVKFAILKEPCHLFQHFPDAQSNIQFEENVKIISTVVKGQVRY